MSIPDLKAARVAFQHIVEYTANRERNGDIFLDGTDAFDAAVRGLRALDDIQAAGYDTGIRYTEQVMAETWKTRGYGWPRDVAEGRISG